MVWLLFEVVEITNWGARLTQNRFGWRWLLFEELWTLSLLVQTMYFTSKCQSVYYSTREWFLKIFKWIICFLLLLNFTTPLSCAGIHFHLKTYYYSLLQSNISTIINGSEKTELNSRYKTSPHHFTPYLMFVLYD